ncbi:MAG: hypothetical protein BWX55_01855 [Deltaproteobacteria bacterium ADurb.Bin022]|nr:MAG: hypothetical protein BWX55_01855 [Deltaproteobacteria bacterium ADurb.Bin022]
MKSNPCRHINIENKFLKGLFYFFHRQIIVADEWSKQGIKIGKGLSAGGFALQRIKEIHHLSQRAAQVIRRFALHFSGHALKSLQQQIIKIPPHAINGQQTQIVNVKIAFRMRFVNFRRVNFIEPVNLADFRRNIIIQSLQGVIHVAVFIDLPVKLLQVLIDEINFHSIGDISQTGVLISINDVRLCCLAVRRAQQNFFNNILNFFYGQDFAVEEFLGQIQDFDR